MTVTFREFIISESKEWFAERNAAIKFDEIIKKTVEGWKSITPDLSDREVKIIADYFREKKAFSLGKAADEIGDTKIRDGLLNAVIKALKAEIASKGYNKAGNSSKTQTQAGRIDSYLKQKHIGPIKR